MIKYSMLIPLIISLTSCFSLWDSGENPPEKREKDVSFYQKQRQLSGNDVIACGQAIGTEDKELNDCISNSFFMYQPFTASIIYYGSFFGSSEHAFAYDGSGLHVLTRVFMPSDSDRNIDRNFVYDINICDNPILISENESGSARHFPFACD